MRELVIDLSATSHVSVDTTLVCQLVGGLRLIHDMCVRWHVLCEMTCIVWDGLRLIHDMYCVRWHTNYGVLDDLVMTNTQTWQQTATHCNTLFMVCWMTWSWPWSWPSRYEQFTHESPSWYDLLTHECPSHTWISQSIWTKSHVNVHRYVDRHSDDDTDDDIPMMIPMMILQDMSYKWIDIAMMLWVMMILGWYCKICHTLQHTATHCTRDMPHSLQDMSYKWMRHVTCTSVSYVTLVVTDVSVPKA